MTNRWDMVQAGKDAVALDVQYIYGAKPSNKEFRVYEGWEINQLRDWYGSDCVWWSDQDKAGSLCCDCSGLMSKATGDIKGTWQLNNEAQDRASLDDLWENWNYYIGWVLYMDGHVGIVSDTFGYYYAMDGSARNAVHLPMDYQNWQYVIAIAGVDYSSDEPESEIDMSKGCIIHPAGEDYLVWFDGSVLHPADNPDEIASVDMVYQAMYGEDCPRLEMGNQRDPWYKRFSDICQRKVEYTPEPW